MSIKRIKVTNFKTFAEETIELNDLNIVIGGNASGKSNLVQLFRFLRDIRTHGLRNAISLQGGIEYLVNRNLGLEKPLAVEIVFNSSLEEELIISKDNSNIFHFNHFIKDREKIDYQQTDKIFKIDEVKYKFVLHFNYYGNEYRVKITEDKAIQKWKVFSENSKTEKSKEQDILLSGERVINFLSREYDESYSENNIDPHDKEKIVSTLRIFSDVFFGKIDIDRSLLFFESPNFFSGNFLKHEDFIFKVSVFDIDPKALKKAIPITGRIELEEDGSNLAIVLNDILMNSEQSRKLLNLTRYLLPFIQNLAVNKLSDKLFMFSLQEIFSNGPDYLPASLISDGTLNCIALVVALYFDPSSLIIIEEPERNIHPHLIARVVKMMKEASQHKQIIVTTHNPEMVKHADLKDLLLISRKHDGFSHIVRPSEAEEVKMFLEGEIEIEDLFIQNLLDLGT